MNLLIPRPGLRGNGGSPRGPFHLGDWDEESPAGNMDQGSHMYMSLADSFAEVQGTPKGGPIDYDVCKRGATFLGQEPSSTCMHEDSTNHKRSMERSCKITRGAGNINTAAYTSRFVSQGAAQQPLEFACVIHEKQEALDYDCGAVTHLTGWNDSAGADSLEDCEGRGVMIDMLVDLHRCT